MENGILTFVVQYLQAYLWSKQVGEERPVAVLNEDLQPSTQIVESMQTPRRSSTLSASEFADLDKHDALVIERVSKNFMKSGGRSWVWRRQPKTRPRILR